MGGPFKFKPASERAGPVLPLSGQPGPQRALAGLSLPVPLPQPELTSANRRATLTVPVRRLAGCPALRRGIADTVTLSDGQRPWPGHWHEMCLLRSSGRIFRRLCAWKLVFGGRRRSSNVRKSNSGLHATENVYENLSYTCSVPTICASQASTSNESTQRRGAGSGGCTVSSKTSGCQYLTCDTTRGPCMCQP